MKKAIVVGGSNGIGLAITRQLLIDKYHVIIIDRVSPDEKVLTKYELEQVTYIYCNLLDMDLELFEELSNDTDIDFLMITAGLGRVSAFEYVQPIEIRNIFEINTIAGIEIIRSFYDRIKDKNTFYIGMMGSIAGLMSSPLFSVYAASKSAIFRFIESVNIELEMSQTNNRIVNISPASVGGTRFNGGNNNLDEINELAAEIVHNVKNRTNIYIPNYENVYKDVLERYKKDPHEYGIHSYEYKIKSGRVINENKVCVGYMSGTFDLFHVGHLNLIRKAKMQCDYLIVGVHPSGSWKNKPTFISFEERKEIVASCKYVDKVIDAPDEDDIVWDRYRYNMLFVGSDYKGTDRFNRYEEEFKGKDVSIVYFPYTKGTSSTQIRQAIDKSIG